MIASQSTEHVGGNAQVIQRVAEVLRRESSRASDLESVAAHAGVSTSEVEERFGSYNGLLLRMVSELTESLLVPLNVSLTDQSFRSTLQSFGVGLASAYSDSHLVGLYRIALTEATRHAGVGKEFFQRGPGCLSERLTTYFSSARDAGLIREGDVKLRADHFLALLRDNLEFSGSDARQDFGAEEAVANAVERFCSGIAVEGR